MFYRYSNLICYFVRLIIYGKLLFRFLNVFFYIKGKDKETDELIEVGEVDIIYASPESLVGDSHWRSTIQRLNVTAIVVDEFHTIATW